MAHIKLIDPSGWDFGCSIAAAVKVASDGKLYPNDRADFIKRASGSEHIFLPHMDRVKFAKDEVPIHLIAMGALEHYGANRNGDGFRKKALQQYFDTFEKFAYFYRNHKNKDPKASYGRVKCAAYNDKMQRVELLVGLNGTKEAAERNGGLIADKELEKLAKDGEIPVSMACRVPYDECDVCGNKAKTRAEYCTENMCKAGGCKKNLTKIVKVGNDIRHVFVHNDHPSFFDISAVHRPADRIAYGWKADYVKSAADSFAKDAEEMEPIVVPDAVFDYQSDFYSPAIFGQIKLASCYAPLYGNHHLPTEYRRAFDSRFYSHIPIEKLAGNGEIKRAFLSACADRKIILPIDLFARLQKESFDVEATRAALPSVYQQLIDTDSLDSVLAKNENQLTDRFYEGYKEAAIALEPSLSLDRNAVETRCLQSAVRGWEIPKNVFWKAAGEANIKLACNYIAYQLSALDRISTFDKDFLLTARLSACQNLTN